MKESQNRAYSLYRQYTSLNSLLEETRPSEAAKYSLSTDIGNILHKSKHLRTDKKIALLESALLSRDKTELNQENAAQFVSSMKAYLDSSYMRRSVNKEKKEKFEQLCNKTLAYYGMNNEEVRSEAEKHMERIINPTVYTPNSSQLSKLTSEQFNPSQAYLLTQEEPKTAQKNHLESIVSAPINIRNTSQKSRKGIFHKATLFAAGLLALAAAGCAPSSQTRSQNAYSIGNLVGADPIGKMMMASSIDNARKNLDSTIQATLTNKVQTPELKNTEPEKANNYSSIVKVAEASVMSPVKLDNPVPAKIEARVESKETKNIKWNVENWLDLALTGNTKANLPETSKQIKNAETYSVTPVKIAINKTNSNVSHDLKISSKISPLETVLVHPNIPDLIQESTIDKWKIGNWTEVAPKTYDVKINIPNKPVQTTIESNKSSDPNNLSNLAARLMEIANDLEKTKPIEKESSKVETSKIIISLPEKPIESTEIPIPKLQPSTTHIEVETEHYKRWGAGVGDSLGVGIYNAARMNANPPRAHARQSLKPLPKLLQPQPEEVKRPGVIRKRANTQQPHSKMSYSTPIQNNSWPNPD